MVDSQEEASGEKSPAPVVGLDTLFLYQNNTSGTVSQTHLTAQQLCRILSSPAAAAITAETNVLQQLPSTSYVSSWKPVKDVPVLREAAALWYYCDGSSKTVKGPVKCRELSKLLLGEEANNKSSMLFSSSSVTNSEWKLLDELPDLQVALGAFDDDNNQQQQRLLSLQQEPSTTADRKDEQSKHNVQQELEAFLSSTDHLGSEHNKKRKPNDHDDGVEDDEEEAYESDNGTRYVKDPRTGNWVHEALLGATKKTNQKTSKNDTTSTQQEQQVSSNSKTNGTNKKQKKAKFSAKKARCWIYVTGLPEDLTEQELAATFSKAGIIDLDPETQKPKIKIYRHKNGVEAGRPKGDASICYARPESVQLAITLLDESPLRAAALKDDSDTAKRLMMKVQAAKFEQHGDTFDGNRNARISNAKRKVAKLAALQAMDWDDGEFNGRLTGGRKGLRIIVLKHLFRPLHIANKEEEEEEEDRMLQELERDLRIECEQWGVVEKITVFSKHPAGVVVVKFTQPGSASEAVKNFNGRLWRERRVEASFWDGVTDYTVRNEEKEEKESKKRQEEFGKWLEREELPEELRLKTE